MKEENLLIDPKNPFGRYKPPNAMLDDVLSGVWYLNTYKHMIKHPDKEFLVPLILFADKTQVDALDRFGLFPVCYTLGIFNRSTRSNPLAWRHLGLIHDIEDFGIKDTHKKEEKG